MYDTKWHLAQNEDDTKVTEFEIQLWRAWYGFIRWQEECEKSVNGRQLTGNELAVLHIIGMQDKPKSPVDIGRLLNRDDIFNIKYSIKKLLALNLIQKVKTKQDIKALHYEITPLGKEDIENYTKIRQLVLIELFKQEPDLNLTLTAKALTKIKAIYDEADRSVSSYTKPQTTNKEEL